MTVLPGNGRSADRGSVARLAATPIYPLLLCLFPVVSLLAWNIQELDPEQAIRSLLVTLAGCLALWGALALITRSVWRAAILTSLAGLLFFSYGHVYGSLDELRSSGVQLARHRFLVPLWAAVFVAVWAMMTVKRASGRSFTPLLNLIGLTALLLPLFSLAGFYIRGLFPGGRLTTQAPMVTLRSQDGEPLPDIYYIILDGYARADIMRDVIGLDNSEFIAFLEQNGFYVAAESRSNHNWTALSLASSLNLTYAQDLGVNMSPGYYPTPWIDPIRHSLVSRSLKEIGYTTLGLQSGYMPTEWVDADLYLGPVSDAASSEVQGLQLNAFESMLLETTVLEPLLSTDIIRLNYAEVATRGQSYPHETLRTIILAEFEVLSQPLPPPGPRLVFAHIVAPHRPYLFTASGEPVPSDEAFTLQETSEANDNDRDLYRDQAAYITSRAEKAIQAILDNSHTPPVIIVQADHGPGMGLGVDERTAILNAILIRRDCRSMLYPSITPVNTFRVVFNCYFSAGLPLAEDNVYWSKWPREAAYEFTLISTDEDLP